ncbi:hypothetical protein D3C76_1683000 [compost metagenome]
MRNRMRGRWNWACNWLGITCKCCMPATSLNLRCVPIWAWALNNFTYLNNRKALMRCQR